MKDTLKDIQQALMTGVSYMLPVVVAGGVLVALGFLFGGYNVPNDVAAGSTFASTLFWIGKIGLDTFMCPVLAAYVAYSIADKPAIAPGLFGGYMALNPWGALANPSGFIGALVAGIIAGYIVKYLKKIPLPISIRSLLPTLIIPLVGCASVCLIMHYIIGTPLGALVSGLTGMLNALGTGNLVLLGIVQGCMLAFDMGGPCNKVAYAFALAAMDTGNYLPMGANFVGSITPPLGLAICILLSKKKWTKDEKAAVPGLFAGAIGMITEFAIPFAAKNPLKVIPALMAGSAVGCVLSYILGLAIQAPHGGWFVFFAMNKPFVFFICIVVGGAVTAALLLLLNRNAPDVVESDEEE
ncbi:MAG: PTS fructose transporter subunit IIC [Lachnospiraceae bacterium]|nr:PTS fructose transporter subunit IIC [Lachnospiraceae bacterium]